MWNFTPFGNPDGSRSNIGEMLQDFVEFDLRRFGDGLGLAFDDLSVRVIAGAKGSGKTVYLRRLQDAASRNDSIYTDALRHDLPQTLAVISFCEKFPPAVLTEMWDRLWHCAILGALVSHVLFQARLKSLTQEHLRVGLEDHIPLLLGITVPVSVYAQAARILHSHHTRNGFERHLGDPKWTEVEHLLEETLPGLPPIFLFLDALDEAYQNAPMHWLRCQQGLFHRTMALLRDPRLGSRVHVVICIRDQVLAAVYHGEHQEKYRGEPHIRTLDWNYDAINYLLETKLERMNDHYLVKPEARANSPMEAWLGHTKIENGTYGLPESVGDYMIRHTRLSPRDLVVMGNELSREAVRARSEGLTSVPPARIRRCVSDIARGIGNEQIAICANQVASSGMPPMAAARSFADVYMGDSEYVRGLDDSIKGVIASLGRDRVSWQELRKADESAKPLFGETSDVFSVLWQNRLIGYRQHGEADETVRFFSERFLDDFNLPEGKAEYVLHPCLHDGLGLEVVGTSPPRLWE